MATSPYRTAAQTGESYGQLRFDPKAAQEYLSGEEAANYVANLTTLAQDPKKKKGKYTQDAESKHNTAVSGINRLRDVAASRAFDTYQDSLSQYTKPWKIQPTAGNLLSEETVADPMRGGTRTFGSGTLLAGEKMTQTLKSMPQPGGGAPQPLDPNLIGSQEIRKAHESGLGVLTNANSMRKLNGPVGGIGAGGSAAAYMRQQRMRRTLGGTRYSSDIIDPVKAYLGQKGGIAKTQRPPDFGY